MSEPSTKFKIDDSTKALVRRLIDEYVKHHRGNIAIAIVFMMIVAASTAAFPQLIKPIINDIFFKQRQDMLIPIAIAVVAVFTIRGLAMYGQSVFMSFVGHRIVADIQTNLFNRLVGADLAFFQKTAPGSLVSRFINDVNLLRSAVSTTLTAIGKDVLTAVALIGTLFFEDWVLATIVTIIFPIAILPTVRIGKLIRKISRNTQKQIGRLTTLLDEAFQGIRYVKAYGMEPYEGKRAKKSIDEVFELNQKASRTSSILHPVMETLGGFAIAAVVFYGGIQVIEGIKEPGSFFTFIFALILAYEPIKRLSKLNANLQTGLAAAQRVFVLMDQEPEIREKQNAKDLDVRGGSVRFDSVSFSYDDQRTALDNVTLSVSAGKTAALVGPSGAGKSTLLNLLPRFYDVNQGAVIIDDQDVRDVTFDSLRGAMALVSQEILLFDDTIGANIAYGRRSASQDDIEAAAKAAGAHTFISETPAGYDTLVGPRGTKLSGGQRQRIAIARAMLKNAPILLLDEATSSLDSESERHVQSALKELMTGRTTLVIAHRLSTIVDADVIFVVENGRIVEHGSHAELLARNGAYARLYTLQVAEEETTSGTPVMAGLGSAS